ITDCIHRSRVSRVGLICSLVKGEAAAGRVTNASPPSCRYSAPSRARARTSSPSDRTSTKKSATSHARRRTSGSLERTTSTPSSRPMARYMARQKSATVSAAVLRDRKSTRLNSSHMSISYAVFCLKKKKNRLVLLYYKERNERQEHCI